MCGICPCPNCSTGSTSGVSRLVAWPLLAAALFAAGYAVWTFVASIIIALAVITVVVLAVLTVFVVRQLRAPDKPPARPAELLVRRPAQAIPARPQAALPPVTIDPARVASDPPALPEPAALPEGRSR